MRASQGPPPEDRPRAATSSTARTEPERLHKRIAASGLCSRRAAEELIRAGRVTVNGATVSEPGTKVSEEDQVCVDDRELTRPRHHYLVMNKPAGYVTTMSDPQGRRTVAHLLPKLNATLKPVGRLDLQTEGLLLFTNDGELANRLTHPRYGVEKEYLALLDREPDEKQIERLRKGVFIEGGKTSPAKVERARQGKGGAALRIAIHEGRNRQVRLMCQAVGLRVKDLKRTRIGFLRSTGLRPGECRMLGQEEAKRLRTAVGL